MTLRPTPRRRLPALVALLLAPAAVATAEDPARYCRRVVTDDTLRPIPPALVPDSSRLFGLRMMSPDQVMRTTSFRCLDGVVLVCTTGANLPCGKANTARDLPGADHFCRDHPGSDFIPMYVTGHDTVWRWRCDGPQALAAGPPERLDSRGFIARFWKRAEP